MKIRKATKKDLSVLADFWYEEEKFTRQFDKTAKLRENAEEIIYNFLKHNLAKNNYSAFIAEDNGEVIGVVQGQIKKGYLVHSIGKVGHYATIFVKEKYRQKGVAKELFKALSKWFKSKNIKVADLYVHTQNKAAFNAWKKLGFKEMLKLMKRELQ